MIEKKAVNGIDTFLRECYGEFSIQTINKYLRTFNIIAESNDVYAYLFAHPLVFQLSENTFVSRASVFTNQFFSIKPTKYEISNGVLIPGHRCMPFIDPDMYPHEIEFTFENNLLKKKLAEISFTEIIEVCFLYGEEFIPQLLAVDPANTAHDYAGTDYTIPNNVEVTVIDMSKLYEQLNFQYGDRLLACVSNWDTGQVDLHAQKLKRSSPFEITTDDETRDDWYKAFDAALLHTISTHGPLSSIEEQLAYTFYKNSAQLCTNLCCSVEEYIDKDLSIAIEYYGVESRLWIKNDEIPAIGTWNEGVKDIDNLVNTLYEEIGIPIPFYMLDAYIFDALFRKEKGFSGIYNRMVPNKDILDSEKEKTFLLHIEERYDKIAKTYNRFIDFEKGETRSRSLELYSDLIKLICELDSCGLPVSSLPQQQLVIVAQLFSHTTKFLEAFMSEMSLSKDDIQMISTSLDGMTESFEDVSADLIIAMGKNNSDGFSII